MTKNELIYSLAEADIGTWEWAGDENNPSVLAYYREAGHSEIKQDSVPWCAAFVGAILSRAGVQNTGSLLARSYEQWGVPVDGVHNAQRGDIVVLSRGDQSWQGHVGFFVGFGAGKVHVLGGNQGDQVNVSPYNMDKIVAIRRAKNERKSPSQSKTVQATTMQVAAAAGTAATAVTQFDGVAQLVIVGFAGLIALSAVWIFKERLRKWAAGDR